MKSLRIHLHTEGVIDKDTRQEMSDSATIGKANKKFFEYILDSPSEKSLRNLSKVIKKYSQNQDNNRDLADLIDDFLSG